MAVVTIQFTALLGEAQEEIALENYASAKSKLLQAQALLGGLPNMTKEGDLLTWNNARITIDALLTNIRKAQNASAGIRRVPVTYVGEE